MVAFATDQDLGLRWADAPVGPAVGALLEDASAWLRASFPAIPETPSPNLAAVLRLVVCAMVKRALLAGEHDHLDSHNLSAGPFTENRSYRNSEGNLFLTKAERDMLDSALAQESGRPRGMRTMEATGW